MDYIDVLDMAAEKLGYYREIRSPHDDLFWLSDMDILELDRKFKLPEKFDNLVEMLDPAFYITYHGDGIEAGVLFDGLLNLRRGCECTYNWASWNEHKSKWEIDESTDLTLLTELITLLHEYSQKDLQSFIQYISKHEKDIRDNVYDYKQEQLKLADSKSTTLTAKQKRYMQDICRTVYIDEDEEEVMNYTREQGYEFIDKYNNIYSKYLQYKLLGLHRCEAYKAIHGAFINIDRKKVYAENYNDRSFSKWVSNHGYGHTLTYHLDDNWSAPYLELFRHRDYPDKFIVLENNGTEVKVFCSEGLDISELAEQDI